MLGKKLSNRKTVRRRRRRLCPSRPRNSSKSPWRQQRAFLVVHLLTKFSLLPASLCVFFVCFVKKKKKRTSNEAPSLSLSISKELVSEIPEPIAAVPSEEFKGRSFLCVLPQRLSGGLIKRQSQFCQRSSQRPRSRECKRQNPRSSLRIAGCLALPGRLRPSLPGRQLRSTSRRRAAT